MSLIAPYAAEHVNTKGAGDARPTAIQIVKDQGLVGKLPDKVMLVTGCSSGIGVETARALATTGAKVFITVRDVAKGEEIVKQIEADTEKGKVQLLEMDLGSVASVKKAADAFLSQSSKLNVLINNAGIMACPEGTTKDGFETQFGTNHMGHFLLFQYLKPALLASSTPEFNSRVVSVSSSAHRYPGADNNSALDVDDLTFKTRDYEPWRSYSQSKVSNVYFANELDRRYGSRGLHAFSLNPGGIWTPLQRHQPGMQALRENEQVQNYMKSPEQGAATSVWAALSKELDGKGGMYLEDCQQAGPADMSSSDGTRAGYAPWAYDENLEKKLWEKSLELVGMKDDK